MLAADPPTVVQPSQAESQADVIEVVATRSQQSQKIDRRTYRVQQNPHSAQKDSLQLLRGLPAVTITPDDKVELLGSPGVTILVDGGPVHGDSTLFLRTLHGSDIERIEIITNPSAQYSSQGSAGIINFVLKKKKEDGLSGSTSNEASNFGALTSGNTLKLKKGKWTYELQAQAWKGGKWRTRYETDRAALLAPAAAPTISRQVGRSELGFRFASLNGRVTYDIDKKTSISWLGFGGAFHQSGSDRSDWIGLTPDFQSFSERQRLRDDVSYIGSELSLNHRGKKEGETLQAFASVYGNPTQPNRVDGNFGDGDPYFIRKPNSLSGTWTKVDWNRPVGERSILSLGLEWTLQWRGHDYEFTIPETIETFDRFKVRQSTANAWGTFQRSFGSWSFMPGVRLERLSRRITSPATPPVHVVRTSVFPTFHMQKPLSKTVNMTLSYSKRIARPGDDFLRPYPMVQNALSVSRGNPALRDQTTDALEANLHYHRKKLDGGVILYDRRTSRLWNTSYFVNSDGVTEVTWINAGHQRDRGAQFDVSLPLLPRVKGNASINLFASQVPVHGLSGDGTYESFRYTANATLEWATPDRGSRPGDVRQLQVQYSNPSRGFETRSSAYYSLNLSWTHSFSPTLSGTVAVNRIGSNRYRNYVTAPLLQSRTVTWMRGPEFRVKLVKTFGGMKSPPPASGPPVPVPR
jgi:outer membrane receptor for ferrienterochelin and colicin